MAPDAGAETDADAATPVDAPPDVEPPTPEALRQAERLLQKADEQRRRADALRPPRFHGGDLKRFIERAFKPWSVKRRKLMSDAAKIYREVIDVQPRVPEAMVAASAGIARMWDAFRRDAESVPEINAEVAKLPAWGGPYALRPSEVLEHNVRSVADICVEYARKYHVENEDSRYCEQMLQTDSGNAP